MPVPNVASTIDFENRKDELTQKAIKLLNQTYGIKIEDHIKASLVITPNDWQKNHNVYRGAVFNLAHNLGQMLNRRPQNKFEEIDHVYLVGGGTHPGSGLPTIYQSALILKNYL
jgi:phytoene desaturase